jgi:hypothetical protein
LEERGRERRPSFSVRADAYKEQTNPGPVFD